MALYTKQTWTAREGVGLNIFAKSNEDAGHVTLTNDPTSVSVAGTPVSVARLQHIEDGLETVADTLYKTVIYSDVVSGNNYSPSLTINAVSIDSLSLDGNITLPVNAPIGHKITVFRPNSASDAYSVSIVAEGSDVIKLKSGAGSVTGIVSIFAKIVSGWTRYAQTFTFEKTSATEWQMVAGCDSGLNSEGYYYKNFDGTLSQRGLDSIPITSIYNANIGTYGWSLYTGTTTIYPAIAFVGYYSAVAMANDVTGEGRGISFSCFSPTATSFSVQGGHFASTTTDFAWFAEGRWI